MWFRDPHIYFDALEEGASGGAAPGDGQGDAGGEGDGGEGGETGQFGGFDTLDELLADHSTIQGQVTSLETLKGRQGTELGDLRKTVAQQNGELNVYRTRPAAPTTGLLPAARA